MVNELVDENICARSDLALQSAPCDATEPSVFCRIDSGCPSAVPAVWPAMHNDRSDAGLGLTVMVALVGGLIDRNTRGRTIFVGSKNLHDCVEMILNAVAITGLAVEKQAKVLLMPVSARSGLNDLLDDRLTKSSIELSKDREDAVFKGLEA